MDYMLYNHEENDNSIIRKQVINFCLSLENCYEDYPFHDDNWTVIRHKGNNKIFAWIFEREDKIWINLKCDLEWRDLWRDTFEAVIPAFHLNKIYWNSVILDGSVPDSDVMRMIEESYILTKGKNKRKKDD